MATTKYKSDRFDDFKEEHPLIAFLGILFFTILMVILAICGFYNSKSGLWPLGIVGTIFTIAGIAIMVDCIKTFLDKQI